LEGSEYVFGILVIRGHDFHVGYQWCGR